MSDERRLPDPLAGSSHAAMRLPPGAAVMVRHSDARARRDLADRLALLCRARGLLLMISDDLDLALACDADGLHLPERVAASADAIVMRRRWRGLLTCAAHGPRALARAALIGADAAVLSSVFETQSHPGRAGAGLMRFLSWTRSARVPVYALGGLAAHNAGRLRDRNLVGLAGVSGFAELGSLGSLSRNRRIRLWRDERKSLGTEKGGACAPP